MNEKTGESAAPRTAKSKREQAAIEHKSSKPAVAFLAPFDESQLTPLPLTKAHFLDAYSKVSITHFIGI